MKWEGREESENVEDRRGMRAKAGLAIGGGSIVVLLLAVVLGIDPRKLAEIIPQGNAPGPVVAGKKDPARPVDPEEERQASFTKVVFRDTEVIWDDLFRRVLKREFKRPVLVLFTDEVRSACGFADAAVGPFYCPGDDRVYIDLGFYKDMERKLGAPGEFARAYVVAHEVGHHVQNQLGYTRKVDQVRRSGSKTDANNMSVRLELQADFLAGVWAHHAQRKFDFLEKGDIESALNAAFEIGDDRLQKKARGFVVPDSFTHGTSKQRMRWFMEGFRSGDVQRMRELFDLDYGDL